VAVPAAIGAAGSVVSNKKGGGGKKGGASPNLEGLYSKFSTILDSGMNLFKTASGTGPDSVKNTDKTALADYQKQVMTQAQSELGAYDASAAASGSPINKSDTAKDRSRTQIAAGLSGDVANKKYAQDESYLARLQALIPGTGSAATGFGAAGAIDSANMNQANNIQDAIFKLAGSGIFGAGKTPVNPFGGPLSNPTNNQGYDTNNGQYA